ncbi:unnamed protein product, partial [Prorocentrum cordatum]
VRMDGWPQPTSAGPGSWRRLVVEFVGEAFVHERLVIRADPNGGSAWIATPDQDEYEEDYRHDPDIVGVTFTNAACGNMKISDEAVIAPTGPLASVKAVSARTLPSGITVAVFLEWVPMQKSASFRDDKIDLYASEVSERRIMKPCFESVDECKLVCEVLKVLQRIDRCNLPNTVGVELLVRRKSVLEEAHASSPSNPDYSAANIMMDWAETLMSYTANRLKDKAAILKEERKAVDESMLGGKSQPPKDKDKGTKD